MKKVWILQRWETVDEMKEAYNDIKDIIAGCDDLELVSQWERVATNCLEIIKNSPNGKWQDVIGRSIYRQFCDVAHEEMSRRKNEKWRVVEGVIEVDATTWVGYKFTKENDGILRYLYATS